VAIWQSFVIRLEQFVAEMAHTYTYLVESHPLKNCATTGSPANMAIKLRFGNYRLHTGEFISEDSGECADFAETNILGRYKNPRKFRVLSQVHRYPLLKCVIADDSPPIDILESHGDNHGI
jgi:hypothetical protein